MTQHENEPLMIRRVPNATQPTADQIRHYETLVPYFQTLLASTAQRYPTQWSLRETDDNLELVHIKLPRVSGFRYEPNYDLVVPKALTGWKDGQSIGWQRGDREREDPRKVVAQEILYVLRTNMHKLEGLFEEVEDDESDSEDIDRVYGGYRHDDDDDDDRYDDWRDNDDGAGKDYAACDLNECGYCGRCMY